MDGAGSVEAAVAPARREHLYFIENMRGIAILLVVLSHCCGLAWNGMDVSKLPNDPIVSVLAGATSIFVFISGFFFHHIFQAGFRYAPFLMKKTRSLLVPYVAISLLLFLTQYAMGSGDLAQGERAGLLGQLSWALLTGTSGPAMWYLPFIFNIFLLSPLFLAFMRAAPTVQGVVLLMLLALGLAVDRIWLNPVANIAHFSFYYAFGIFCSLYRAQFVAIASRNWVLAACTVSIAGLAMAQYLVGSRETPEAAAALINAQDFIYLQKIALILLLAGLMARMADHPVRGLTLVAQWSFGLFFVHQIALLLLEPVARAGWFALGPDYVRLALVFAVVFAMSLAFVGAAKLALGRYSRLLVGA